MSFWDTLGSVAQGLIEIGPVKIDNDTVEKIVGAGAVLIAGYAAYKVLNDKGSAENVAMLAGRATELPEKSLYNSAEAEANVARMKAIADEAEANFKAMERCLGPLPNK